MHFPKKLPLWADQEEIDRQTPRLAMKYSVSSKAEKTSDLQRRRILYCVSASITASVVALSLELLTSFILRDADLTDQARRFLSVRPVGFSSGAALNGFFIAYALILWRKHCEERLSDVPFEDDPIGKKLSYIRFRLDFIALTEPSVATHVIDSLLRERDRLLGDPYNTVYHSSRPFGIGDQLVGSFYRPASERAQSSLEQERDDDGSAESRQSESES